MIYSIYSFQRVTRRGAAASRAPDCWRACQLLAPGCYRCQAGWVPGITDLFASASFRLLLLGYFLLAIYPINFFQRLTRRRAAASRAAECWRRWQARTLSSSSAPPPARRSCLSSAACIPLCNTHTLASLWLSNKDILLRDMAVQ